MIRIKNVTYLILLLSFTFPLLGMEIVERSLSNPALPLALCTLNLERKENDFSGVMLKGFVSQLSSFVTGSAPSLLKYVPGVRLFCFFKEIREEKERYVTKRQTMGDNLLQRAMIANQEAMVVNELEAYFQQIRRQGKVYAPGAMLQQIRKKREEPIKKHLEKQCNNLEKLIRRKKFREALELYIMLKPCQLVSESFLRSKVSSGFSYSGITSIRDDGQMECFKRFFYLLNNQEDLNGQYDGIPQLFSSDVLGDEVGSSLENLTNNSPENYEQEDSGSSSGDIVPEINLADVVQPVWQRTGRIEGQKNAAYKIGIHRERNKEEFDGGSSSPEIEGHNKRSKEPLHNNLNDQDDGIPQLSSSDVPGDESGSASANLTNNSKELPENYEQEHSGSSSGDIVPEIDLEDAVQGERILEGIAHQLSLSDAISQEQRDGTSPNIGVRTGYFTGLKKKCVSFLKYLKELCGYSKPPWTIIESFTFDRTKDESDCSSYYSSLDVEVNVSESIRTKIKNIFLSFIRLSSFRRFFSH